MVFHRSKIYRLPTSGLGAQRQFPKKSFSAIALPKIGLPSQKDNEFKPALRPEPRVDNRRDLVNVFAWKQGVTVNLRQFEKGRRASPAIRQSKTTLE